MHNKIPTPNRASTIGWLFVPLAALALLLACAKMPFDQPDQCPSPYEADEDGDITFTPKGLHEIRLATRRFWSGSLYDEPWEQVAQRAVDACGAKASLGELVLVAAEHPRTHRETFWKIDYLGVLKKQYRWTGGGIYDKPRCKLIRDALAPVAPPATSASAVFRMGAQGETR